MRVGIDAACLLVPKSGVAEYTLGLLHAMAGLRDMTYVLFCNSFRHGPGNGLPKLEPAQVKVTTLRFPSRLLGSIWRVVSFPRADWLTGPLDLFHSTNYRVLPLGRIPQVVTVYDVTVLKFPHYHPMPRVVEISGWLRRLHKADAVVAISDSTRRDILELLDVLPERVHVVYPGYNAALFSSGVTEEAIARVLRKYGIRRPYILFVGNLEPRKNLVRLVQAFSLLRERGFKEHTLVLTGQKEWLCEDVFLEVQRQGMEEMVSFTGHVADQELPALYRGAAVFAYPSIYEGFGFPPLEAMACGTPVVTSNVSSLPEVVGDAALLVDPYDVEGLAAALERAISDGELREELVAKGLQRAARFSWQEAALKTLSLYDAVVAEKKGL